MVHRPVCPGSLRMMCLRLIAQSVFNFVDAKPKIEKYLQLCGPTCRSHAEKLIDYIRNYFPTSLKDLLFELLTQLWFSRLLKMKQKTIDHERWSSQDANHDHATCGGTTSVPEAQKHINLLSELLHIGFTQRSKVLRLGFTNARSGPVDIKKPFSIVIQNCDNLRILEMTFATDSWMPRTPRSAQEKKESNTDFNYYFTVECLPLCRKLASINKITTLKLLVCSKAMLKEIAKCSKLQILEITEAQDLTDEDILDLSQGPIRHNLSHLTISYWNNTTHLNNLCDNHNPQRIVGNFTQNKSHIRLPSWAIALLNCPNLQEVVWFDPSPHFKPFNPCLGLLTILREAQKLFVLDIENEADLLDKVIEKPADLKGIKFKWTSLHLEVSNDGFAHGASDDQLNENMEFILESLPHLNTLTFIYFPSEMEFPTFRAMTTTPAGLQIASKLKTLKLQVSQPSQLVAAAELVEVCKNIDTLVIEQLQLGPHDVAVLSLDLREVLNWLSPSVKHLKIRGFHLIRRGEEPQEGKGKQFPHITHLEVVFCVTQDKNLLHVACLCPNLEKFTVVVSMGGAPGPCGTPQPPPVGMDASHLHSLCHAPNLTECVVLIKTGEGWIQIDDRETLGELVLGVGSEKLRKIVLFPVRGVCGGGMRTLVRAAKEANICLNIGIGNQRPVKTEINRRTAIDEFTLVDSDDQNLFKLFGEFLDRKVSEFGGQFWNDPDWFYGNIWPEPGQEVDTSN